VRGAAQAQANLAQSRELRNRSPLLHCRLVDSDALARLYLRHPRGQIGDIDRLTSTEAAARMP
jgi:hypothetical protein